MKDLDYSGLPLEERIYHNLASIAGTPNKRLNSLSDDKHNLNSFYANIEEVAYFRERILTAFNEVSLSIFCFMYISFRFVSFRFVFSP